MYDMQGKLMIAEILNSSSQINITDLSIGMYIVQIISKEGNYATSRLSVAR